ncbi:2,5-diamino-6-(ribosylamino)-4(3H)-pyrimidinone 5'-phosphate reductase [Microbotryomycetes sp. JL221]|nr:2,5-diamino-6-(ribosylamino)-4(3H)-pyrimidinone 5'-phosphate reductase [Microbotryomycetes sp. JL221]
MLDVHHQPTPIVLDTRLSITPQAKLVLNGRNGVMPPPVVICDQKMLLHTDEQSSSVEQHGDMRDVSSVVGSRLVALAQAGVQIVGCDTKDDRLDLAQVFRQPQLGNSVMVEGGAQVISTVLAQGLCDIVIITVSPKIVGDGVSAFQPGVSLDPTSHGMHT